MGQGELESQVLKLGSVLFKATGDHHKYFCRLRTGERICFFHAHYQPGSEWIDLTVKDVEPPLKDNDNTPINTQRGMSVRLSDIVWAVDFEKA